MDTTTGFKINNGIDKNQITPISDKNSILGTKPFLGVKKQFGRSPDPNQIQTAMTNKSNNMSEMKLQFGGAHKEIEEEISISDDNMNA